MYHATICWNWRPDFYAPGLGDYEAWQDREFDCPFKAIEWGYEQLTDDGRQSFFVTAVDGDPPYATIFRVTWDGGKAVERYYSPELDRLTREWEEQHGR